MNIQTWLRTTTGLLQTEASITPRLDAEVLLAHASGHDRAWLIAHADDTLPTSTEILADQMRTRRCTHEPVAYIIGEKEFWSHNFKVTPDVLIPRPETEHLIEAVLTCFPDRNIPYRFCDMGTGSGCIAITLAHEFPRAKIIATDIDPAALSIARQNAIEHHVNPRIDFRESDMFSALRDDEHFHLMISNPPYVAMDEMKTLAPGLSFEPAHALTDKQDGLYFLRLLSQQAIHCLYSGAYLIVETGLCGLPPDPSPPLLLKKCIHDLAGRLRGGIYQHSQ